MKSVLVSSHTLLLPIIRQLAQRPDLEFVAIQPNMAKMLTDLGVPARSSVDLITPEMRDAANTYAAFVLRNVLNAEVTAPSRPAGAWLGPQLPAFLYPRLPDIAMLACAIESLHPSLVLVHNDVEPVTRAACMWAASHNVPAIHIPHAIYLEHSDRRSRDIHDITTASYLTASSDYQAEWYAQRSPTLRIAITGLPQYDKWANLRPNRDTAAALLGLSPLRPIVTYASSWHQATNLRGAHNIVEHTYENFLAAAARLPDCQFIVKIHPSGNNAEYHIERAKAAGVHAIVTAPHLEQVLQASDLVLSCGPSNLLLEAAHIPWLRLAATDGFYDDPEVIKVPNTANDMHDAITTSLATNPPPYQSFLSKYLGQRDGFASARIVALSQHLIDNPPSQSQPQP